MDKINDRFPHVELIDAFTLFDPQALPSDEDEFNSYGQDKLEVLLSTVLIMMLIVMSARVSGKV